MTEYSNPEASNGRMSAKPSDFPGNSNKSRIVKPEVKEKKSVEKITDGVAIQRKRPLSRKVFESFSGEGAQDAGSYVLFDVLIPAAKTAISDAVSQFVERKLFGDNRSRSSSSSGRRNNFTEYNRMHNSSSSSPMAPKRDMSSRARAGHDFNEIVLATRGEAETVMDTLGELVNEYGQATVSDLYDLVGITGSFTDDKYGWTDLREAKHRRVREGYLLDLPKTTVLD